jgi:hypothetical protein
MDRLPYHYDAPSMLSLTDPALSEINERAREIASAADESRSRWLERTVSRLTADGVALERIGVVHFTQACTTAVLVDGQPVAEWRIAFGEQR